MIVDDCPGHIIKIIHSYLQDRKFYTKIQNTPTRACRPGLPHLYTIMTHDMSLGQNGVQTALYANDTAEIATRRLDIHVNRTLIPYLEKNKMKINPTKTENTLLAQIKTEGIIG